MEQDQLDQSSPPTKLDTSVFRAGKEHTDIFVNYRQSQAHDRRWPVFLTVYLIDTPGFDDTSLSEVEILRTLAAWLAATYGAQIRLHGVLYLHRITDVRLGGSAKRSLRMFQELCGSDELRNVILATTMWNLVSTEDGVRRETELMETQDFWGCMLERGSRVERHAGDAPSAQRLLGMFLGPDRRDGPAEMALAIQKEIVDDGMNLQETRAANERGDRAHREGTGHQYGTADTGGIRRQHGRVGGEEGEESGRAIQGNSDEGPRRTSQQSKTDHTVYETPFSESVVNILQRSPTDHIERPDLPTRTSEGQMPRPPSVTSSQFSLLRLQRTAHARRPVGTHWPKRARRDISLSLRGHHCSFTGPVHSKSYLPQATLNILVGLETSRNIRMKRIVLGEGPAYYAHYHKGTLRTKCYCASNFSSRPRIRQSPISLPVGFLHENGNLSCPQSISLGPAGSYFIRVDGRRSFRCHPNAAIDEKAESAARLWWGVDGAYVLECEATGQLEWDLRGSYSELEEILQAHHSKKRIWELAMNIEDKCSFAVIFDDGSAFHDGKDDIICSMFDEAVDVLASRGKADERDDEGNAHRARMELLHGMAAAGTCQSARRRGST
ncbi:hypothetical protein PG991_003556 [Apiospora marii]|uniref:G domain-containing protein n=1 Tax=Apiospora marii TaxID=335849 RepID=A0ABR1S3S8_9PEZI